MRISFLLAAVVAFEALGFADGIQLTVYGAPLSSSIANPVDITFLMGIGINDGPRSVITRQLGFPYTSIVFSLPAQPIGYYVGPAEGALYIWLAPDTTSINLLPMARLFAPPVPEVTITVPPVPAPFIETVLPGPAPEGGPVVVDDGGAPPFVTTPPGSSDPPASGSPDPRAGAVPTASVPEPSAYALLAAGAGTAMWRARRRAALR